jgi:hypothetical protein
VYDVDNLGVFGERYVLEIENCGEAISEEYFEEGIGEGGLDAVDAYDVHGQWFFERCVWLVWVWLYEWCVIY